MPAADRAVGPKNVFDHVSLRARLTFYAGVFCVFAPFSLIYDLVERNYVAEAPWTFLNSIIDTAIPTRECDPLSPGSDREISPRPYAPEPPLSLVLRGEILQVHNLVNRTPLR